MKTRITSFLLAALLLCGCMIVPGAAVGESDYPELVITEISSDQYGEGLNPNNTNGLYRGVSDPYDFLEIYNNSDKTLNIYDYMIGYQGANVSGKYAYCYEALVQEYTPIFPGSDWIDSAYTSRSWSGMPANSGYADGALAPGEVCVIWVYGGASHTIKAQFEDFRSFWSIPESTKVFLLDGDTNDTMNFQIKEKENGTYIIMKQSERYPARRSADSTFNPEPGPQAEGVNYETQKEIISFAHVNYYVNPILDVKTEIYNRNCTFSYMPYTAGIAEGNGYVEADRIRTNKRMHLDRINAYGDATVGALTEAQQSAFSNKRTSTLADVAQAYSHQAGFNTVKNEKIRPDILITEIGNDQYGGNTNNTLTAYGATSGSDVFEFLEVVNNADHPVNIYEYMVGYQGSGATTMTTYFEKLIQEYTAIIPGADWIDAPYTAYDSYWTGSEDKRPVNPSYAEGVLQPGETALLWFYNKDSHTLKATVQNFKDFWQTGSAKVFLVDGNSDRAKNFGLKNSDTGTYLILQSSERLPARRSDDETFKTECDKFYSLTKSYEDMPEVVSWAVVDFGYYDPLYSYSSNNSNGSFTTNHTFEFAPYHREKNAGWGNGFLTTTFFSHKRMILLRINKTFADTNAGRLSTVQKELLDGKYPKS